MHFDTFHELTKPGGTAMKKYILFSFILCIVAFSGISVSAQCDPSYGSQIKCSYYNEGYNDGANDARSNRNSDYRRYRNKYESRYEADFRNGYNAGYDSVRGSGDRWTLSQRSAYDSGYTIGQSDRRSGGQTRSNESNSARYDQNIGLYFQQGYFDGFNNRQRQYDVPINGVPPVFPPFPGGGGGGGGGTAGSASWSGRVDDRANVIIRGNQVYAENVSGTGVQTTYQNVNGNLRRASTINVQKREGRGSISVIQQPNRSNNFTGIVQIYDPKSGYGNYRLDITWAGGINVDEPYQSGSVRWRGRVDQTVNIIIDGSDVQSQDMSGGGLSNVNFNINGYLAHRGGTVSVRKRGGRGSVTVLQQPSRYNDFTAIVQVFDPQGGADNYDVEITW